MKYEIPEKKKLVYQMRFDEVTARFAEFVKPAQRGAPARLVHDRLKQVDAARRDAVVNELASLLGVDPQPIDDDERALTPEEVGALARLGFSMGSHSATHPILPLESADRIWHEVADSQSLIAEWIDGRPVALEDNRHERLYRKYAARPKGYSPAAIAKDAVP